MLETRFATRKVSFGAAKPPGAGGSGLAVERLTDSGAAYSVLNTQYEVHAADFAAETQVPQPLTARFSYHRSGRGQVVAGLIILIEC
jgi:hypothetical protein